MLDTSNTLVRSFIVGLLAGSLGLVGMACGDSGQDGDLPPIQESDPQPTPEEGENTFASAAAQNGEQTQENGFAGNAEADGRNDAGSAAPGGKQRTVEEGDIYQVVDHSDQILNLNRYRGLQVIDVSDPTNPTIIGRARIHGEPVEMYQVGDQVYALLNSWRGYYVTQETAILPDTYEGGVVAVIDISDPTNPKVTNRTRVPGYIQTSRLTRGGGDEALFAVASEGRYTNGRYQGETYVRSFAVSGQGALTSKTKLDLGGDVQDINAMNERLLVARRHISNKNGSQHVTSKVSVIDISDPKGTMVEGDSVEVEGQIQDKHNLHYHDGILRVVSGATWGGTRTNHVQTYDASNIQSLQRLDHKTFGDGERLEATLFMEDQAFFVTYFQVDPFHAFSIGPMGQLEQKSEFVVSGWNDFFVPTHDGDRLVGIGMNDQNGRTMAVSLYDITDLSNPDPMITRKEIDLRWSHSEANQDDRAFTVLENATAVQADDGTVETGMVLLPYAGWDDQSNSYETGVQIFTFSRSTLTRRATMSHGTPVRRTFMSDRSQHETANLSEAELSLFDTSQPDSPTELGRVDLAPNYERFWTFDQYGVRRDSRDRYYYWYVGNNGQQKQDTLEVVPMSENPDTASSIAEISIPAGAQVSRKGDTMLVIDWERTDRQRQVGTQTQQVWNAYIDVWNFSDPSSPTLVRSLTTDRLMPQYSYAYGGGYGNCFDCGSARVDAGYYYYDSSMEAPVASVGNAAVFVNRIPQREKVGTRHVRYTYPAQGRYYYGQCNNSGSQSCTYYTGTRYCRWTVKTDGTRTAQTCNGGIRECTVDSDGTRSCDPVDPDSIRTQSDSYSYEHYDHWVNFELVPMDLTDPNNPTLRSSLKMPTSERDVDFLTSDSKLYITHKQPYDVQGDTRPYVRYYYKTVDFSDPSNPQTGTSINIPGRLLAVDGQDILTRDFLWGSEIVESSINLLRVYGNTAYLRGTHRFTDRQIQGVEVSTGGDLFVSHNESYYVTRNGNASSTKDGTYLTILDGQSKLNKLSEVRLADWATLQAATPNDRALFSVPGGLLVVDATQPASPSPQAFFPTRTWPRDVYVDGNRAFMAAGSYGIYDFDLTANNLLFFGN